MVKKILMPLPQKDVDPTESGVPWQVLTAKGIKMVFATPNGLEAECDQIMLTGKGLGCLASLLSADQNGRNAYYKMVASNEFKKPLKWSDIKHDDFDGLILPGGHAKGMREYLESSFLQKTVADFFRTEKPVSAICHGVLLVARSFDRSGKSVLFGRKTTALLAPQELLAWALTCTWMKNYYRTYPKTVQAEVASHLATPKDFVRGPMPISRDNPTSLSKGFTVRDKNYLSARWPGDAHRFATDFLELLETL